jgi:hypothetical protein
LVCIAKFVLSCIFFCLFLSVLSSHWTVSKVSGYIIITLEVYNLVLMCDDAQH